MNSTFFKSIIYLAVFSIMFVAIVPVNPQMPGAGLDSSWVFALAEALSQGMVFGKDFIFTFGPYGGLYTRLYTPETYPLVLFASIYLTLCYSVGFVSIARRNILISPLLAVVFFIALILLRDVMFMLYPLLAGLVVWEHAEKKNNSLVSIIIVFSGLGLIVLVKGSALAMVATAVVLSSLFLAFKNKKKLSVIVPLTSLFSLWLFWMLAGYSIWDISGYFVGMSQIVSGYTEAMLLNSNGKKLIHIGLYVVTSTILLSMIILNNRASKSGKLFLFLLFGVYLFASFKAGFVRHDGHAMISADALLMGALFLTVILEDKRMVVVMVLVLVSWALIVGKYKPNLIKYYPKKMLKAVPSFTEGYNNRGKLNTMYSNRVASISREGSIDILPGTSDVYLIDQSYLIASGNNWAPRPIFQSYSAYTPELLRINEAHLRSNAAPDHIIFKPQTIDSRYPTLDDGLSWPTILHNYTLVKVKNDFAYLDKKNSENEAPTFELLGQKKQRLADKVTVPQDNGIIYVEMDIQATVFGKLMTTFFKPKRLTLLVEFDDGEKRRYRIISGMTKTGFIISPLIEKTEDFTALYNEDDFKQLRRVSHFKIKTTGGTRLFWKDSYNLKMSRIDHEYQL